MAAANAIELAWESVESLLLALRGVPDLKRRRELAREPGGGIGRLDRALAVGSAGLANTSSGPVLLRDVIVG